MNRREFLSQIGIGAPAVTACADVNQPARPVALLEALPICPECGLVPETVTRHASPTGDSEVRCYCGWSGITRRFVPPARGCE